MKKKLRICLYELTHPIIIIKEKTNIVYYNQVGGTACLEEEEEGFLVPIGIDVLDFGYERDHLGFSKQLADEFDSIMEEYKQPIIVDRDKLHDCHEAWVHINIINNSLARLLFNDIHLPVKAVITWDNSD